MGRRIVLPLFRLAAAERRGSRDDAGAVVEIGGESCEGSHPTEGVLAFEARLSSPGAGLVGVASAMTRQDATVAVAPQPCAPLEEDHLGV
jgi:hypothetical protein